MTGIAACVPGMSPAGGPLFPEDLGAIREPELVALLAEYDRTGGTGIGSGAEDWAKLPQEELP